jgi:hypothetical protein
MFRITKIHASLSCTFRGLRDYESRKFDAGATAELIMDDFDGVTENAEISVELPAAPIEGPEIINLDEANAAMAALHEYLKTSVRAQSADFLAAREGRMEAEYREAIEKLPAELRKELGV